MKRTEIKGVLLLVLVFLLAGAGFFFAKKDRPAEKNEKKEIIEKKVEQMAILPEKSFGNLKKIVSQENISSPVSRTVSSTPDGQGASGEKMMIYPGPPMIEDYQLVYAGGDFVLPEGSVEVLKRKKGKGEGGEVLWKNLFQNFSKMAKLDVSSFEKLTVSSLNFYEDKDFGLNFSLDLENSSAYVSPQWDRWQNSSPQLTEKDWLSEEEFLKISDEFLEKIGINKNDYEKGKLENNDRWMPMSSEAINVKKETVSSEEVVSRVKEDFVPEIATVFYQQKIENQKVFDFSGNQEGLRVEVDVRQKKVRGASPITSADFSASAYPAEIETQRIIEIAEKGGWKRDGGAVIMGNANVEEGSVGYQAPKYPFEKKPKKKEVKLGKPDLGLVKIWDWSPGNGRSEELFVPAFIFPVLGQEENFWPKNIIVPAVKEE